MMKKLFISQPMKGKTDSEILEERETAMEAARNALGEDDVPEADVLLCGPRRA